MATTPLGTGASTPLGLEAESKPNSISPIADVEKQDQIPGEDGAGDFVRPLTTWQWVLVCVGLYLGALLYGKKFIVRCRRIPLISSTGLDTTIAADVQGPILESLGEIEKLAWVGIGFPMGSVAVILLIGNIYGLFNIKYTFIISQILFEAGSALCGGAPTMNAMIIGRKLFSTTLTKLLLTRI